MNMKINVELTSYSAPEALIEWLQTLGHHAQRLETELGAVVPDESKRLLLGYHHPEVALQQALQQGEAPLAAMGRWAEQARRLIACFKANRGAAVLIDLGDLQRAPREAYQALMAHWAIEVEMPESLPPLPLPTEALDADLDADRESDHDITLALLAREALRQFLEWPELSSQLEACSLPLVSGQASCDGVDREEVDTLFQRWQTAQQRHRTTLDSQLASQQEALKQQAEREEENRLLLEQLHLVQEELEGVFKQNKTLSKQHSALADEKAALQRQLDERSTEAQRLSQQLEEQRKAYQQASERLKQQEAHQREQQHRLKEAQQAHKALLSQKATLDKQLESQKATLAEAEEESSLLLEQLHLVQEELERSILCGQDKDRRLAELEQMQPLLHRRLAKLREVSESRARALDIAETRLAEQQTAERIRVLALAALLQAQTRGKGRHARKTLKRKHELIAGSGLFDRDWYLEQYPDVKKAKVNPISHYLESGAGEGRNPSPSFDTAWYLLTYPDVAESGLNPLVHYIRFGRHEHRAPHPNLLALPAPVTEVVG